jgi:predicted AlkP superfamily phosphohydrolase/phosphomutase
MFRLLAVPASLLALALLWAGCTGSRGSVYSAGTQLIVLGIDGMDPAFLERHWRELPEADALRRAGGFQRLATTNPPQSPVAWSTFITGLNPGGHGIFDFVHRDPGTMLPVSSMSSSREGGRRLTIGSYVLPLSGGRVVSHRRGTPFWELLADRGVPVTILRMPTEYPPAESAAQILSGMGTPDLRGTFGTFTFFTDDPRWAGRKTSGGEIRTITLKDHHAVLRLPGPANSLRTDKAATSVEIQFHVDPKEEIARFDVGDHHLVLGKGEWSNWIPVQFSLLGPFAQVNGIFRIYVKQLHPHVGIYVSPVNIDPSSPAMPISSPASYSEELADQIGEFYTLGMPYDTAAFRHGLFTRAEYREHSRQVSEQAIRLFKSTLNGFREGLLFFHFFGIDQDSHMLWGDYEKELLETYQRVDQILGFVRRKAPGATLLVMSDHGFASFDRAVHLNRWLVGQDLLAVDGRGGIDWSRTKAYAIGLNAVYINQLFREQNGIVAAGEESTALVERIRSGLLKFRDPKTGASVVDSVTVTGQAFGADAAQDGPDLLVGYANGYRASWQTALGEVPDSLVEANQDEWRGDHCIDPRHVPGVLLSSRKMNLEDPRLEDVTATILGEFGAPLPDGIQGRSLYVSTDTEARQRPPRTH